MEPLNIYLTGISREAEAKLLGALRDLNVSRLSEPPSGADPKDRPGVAVIGLNGNADGAFALVARLAASGTRVAVVGPAQDSDLILRAMRAGAREFAVSGETERIAAAVRGMIAPEAGLATGETTVVFPAKGGMGATTIATNLAAALAGRGQSSCLVDLDLQLGDVTAFLDVRGGYTITDVIANMRRLDRDLLEASVVAHRSGVRVLAQAERIEEGEHVDAESIGKLLGFLRQHFSHVVVDGLRGFDDRALAALDHADRIMLVVTQEVPAVRNAQRCVALFRKLSYPDSKIELVVNRLVKGSNITPEVIAETVGLPVTTTLGNDFASATRAIQRGSTILEEAPRSPLSHELATLAERLAGAGDAAPSGGFLKRLFGGR